VWREKVSQWCYDVVDHLGESRDVVYLAMNVLDRYCVLQSTLEERDYEIAAMAALFLAVRVSGRATLELPQLLNMSRLGVRMREILDIGKIMTSSLSWERRLVTPLDFVRVMLDLLNVSSELKSSLLESASYLAEVSVCDAFFSGLHPFKVACAAVANAIGAGPQSRLDDMESREFFLLVSKLHDAQEEISLLRSRLHHIYSQSEENNQSALHVILDEEDEVCVVVPPREGIRVVSSQSLCRPSPITIEEEKPSSKHVLRDERTVSPTPSKKPRSL
jgi:lipoyl(octanoyl) transferase